MNSIQRKWRRLFFPAIAITIGVSSIAHAQFDTEKTKDSDPCVQRVANPQWVKNYQVQGIASSVDNKPLYIEKLSFKAIDGEDNLQGGVLEVEYRLPDGEMLAEKTVSYSCRMTAPDFQLRDAKSSEDEGVIWQGGELISYQKDQSEVLTPPKGNLIIDAGFDHFIKQHWRTLIDGKAVKVNYLFPRDNVFIKLRVQKSSAPNGLNEVELAENRDIVFFKISANNLLFRLFSSPISVGYDSSQSLRYFIGPSNLPMMRDQKQVIIRYSNS